MVNPGHTELMVLQGGRNVYSCILGALAILALSSRRRRGCGKKLEPGVPA